jgi:hypothetical protein
MKALILACLLLYLLYYMIEETNQNTRTLEQDGFCILQSPKEALTLLPGYQFMDYLYEIEDSALSTFHRDVTSSKTVYQTDHPVYTLIHYLYEGDLLSVCPGSHRSPFVGRILNLEGRGCFLFDCDLLHAGRINHCKERRVIQYKLCHPDDLDKLSHLQGIRVHKQEACHDTFYVSFIRKLSYYVQFPLLLATPLMIQRHSDDTLGGKIQSVIPLSYYNR